MPKSDEDHKIATLDDLVERLTELTIKLNKEEAPTSNLSNAPPRDDNIDSDDEEIDEMSVAAQRRKFNKLDISIYKNATTSLTSLAYIGMYGADGVTLIEHKSVALCFKSITFPWCHSFLKACGVKDPILG